MSEKVKLSKVLKLDKVLGHGDSIEIGNGFFVEIYFRDLEVDAEKDVYIPATKDSIAIEKELPVTFIVKHDYGIHIANVKGSPYIHGGESEDRERIYQKNLNRQRKDINEILIDLEYLIETRTMLNDEQNAALAYSLTYMKEKNPASVKVDHVLKHGDTVSFPCKGGEAFGFRNYVEILFRKYDDHSSVPYNPISDEKSRKKWPTCFVVRDDDGNMITTVKGKSYISGGQDDEENIKNQNQSIGNIYKRIEKIVSKRIEDNESNNDLLEEIHGEMEERDFAPVL